MMSDFEDRLSAVLTEEAGEAPHAAGLAREARRRRDVRRRRRISGGGVAAVLAIAAPVAVVAGMGDGGNGDERVGTDAPSGSWQTVESEDVRAEIPPDWSRFSCDFDGFERDIFGPSEADACDFGTYAAFYGSATFDPMNHPGVITTGAEGGAWAGYVYAGDQAVSVSTDDRDLTRQILASARVEGQPTFAADRWQEVSGDGLGYEVPAEGDVGVTITNRPDGEPVVQSVPEQLDESHVQMYGDVGDLRITVTAPTQAVAELVLASVTSSSSTEDWQQFEAEGVEFQVPPDWAPLVCIDVGQSFAPPGSGGCGEGSTSSSTPGRSSTRP